MKTNWNSSLTNTHSANVAHAHSSPQKLDKLAKMEPPRDDSQHQQPLPSLHGKGSMDIDLKKLAKRFDIKK